MPVQEPDWWYRDDLAWQAALLQPVAAVYGAIAARRIATKTRTRSRLPVICVGNFTAGGTGKTPMALALANLVEREGKEPWFLSRGYGGRLDGQERVDPERHRAIDVGDEPMLLAQRAPTVIAKDRRLGAELIERQAPQNAVIILDDGLQNPALFKDLTLALVDGRRGVGNGHVIPAGPLRAPLGAQFGEADAVVVMGDQGARSIDVIRRFNGPMLSARTVPAGDIEWLRGTPVAAYAGIANPQRFFESIETLGGRIVERRVFKDHHLYSELDAEDLLKAPERLTATLVTTAKDHVRLAGVGPKRDRLAALSKVLRIEIEFDAGGDATLSQLVRGAISR